jgi:hypothetical protein
MATKSRAPAAFSANVAFRFSVWVDPRLDALRKLKEHIK